MFGDEDDDRSSSDSDTSDADSSLSSDYESAGEPEAAEWTRDSDDDD